MKRKVGLIVNPIAGMGGRVGLKGTDGEETLKKALKLGAKPVTPSKAVKFLEKIKNRKEEFELLTGAGNMGEEEAKKVNIEIKPLGLRKEKTTREDTKKIAEQMLKEKVELIIFFGGDGTAVDLCETVDAKVPVIGVPSGVKMYSGVFALNIDSAFKIFSEFLDGKTEFEEREVVEVNEQAFREDRLVLEIKGYLKVPVVKGRVQNSKTLLPSDEENKTSIAKWVIDNMNDSVYILGPGSTVSTITKMLNQPKTFLGVDAMYKKRVIGLDLNEKELLKIINDKKAKIVVSPLGKQGFIFGRGNQQISPEVIKKVGIKNIILVATKSKVIETPFFHVDTGDPELDHKLKGYKRVIVDYAEEYVKKVI